MKFTARLADERVLTEKDCPSVSKLPLDQVLAITIEVEGLLPVSMAADVLNGERIQYFVRHVLPVGAPEFEVSVFELSKNGKTLCRLYWHPENGPLLTTQDLYFR